MPTATEEGQKALETAEEGCTAVEVEKEAVAADEAEEATRAATLAKAAEVVEVVAKVVVWAIRCRPRQHPCDPRCVGESNRPAARPLTRPGAPEQTTPTHPRPAHLLPVCSTRGLHDAVERSLQVDLERSRISHLPECH